ncbi:Uncharacterised protein [Erysipelothrix amsterdamensis]|uniref:Uncharacterized protein n=1 Tax=Erysipelothrix amsterdamensis TaxID=2929157 RepID=A0AAU9VLC6_9FIRM|nr:hypothetical protein [Erysipelothrix rhusiopathiae]CAH2763353.1 Uncharacterised protein [Erysipelothrix sp. A18Y020d]CAH2763396.1 Uncharacterised protein [Erysipelothrix sp. A18Y020d]
MDSFIKVSTLATIELGDLFNEYHTLKPVREVNDCVRKQLYNSFNEIRNFLEEIFILSFHFKTELESDSINYENIVYRLLEFTKDKYDFENKDDCTIFYTKFKFDLDQPVNKIHQILNSNFDAILLINTFYDITLTSLTSVFPPFSEWTREKPTKQWVFVFSLSQNVTTPTQQQHLSLHSLRSQIEGI